MKKYIVYFAGLVLLCALCCASFGAQAGQPPDIIAQLDRVDGNAVSVRVRAETAYSGDGCHLLFCLYDAGAAGRTGSLKETGIVSVPLLAAGEERVLTHSFTAVQAADTVAVYLAVDNRTERLLYGKIIAQNPQEYRLEAETYLSDRSYPIVQGDAADFSGGSYVSINELPADGVYQLSYTFWVETDGFYTIGGIATDRGRAYTSDWYVSVNGRTVDEYRILADVPVTGDAGLYKQYSFGAYRLQKGVHTMQITVDKADVTQTGRVVAYFDYFTVRLADDCVLHRITFEGSQTGTFAEGEEIFANLEFTKAVDTDVQYRYQVMDLQKAVYREGTAVISVGTAGSRLALGNFPVGWYRLYLWEETGMQPLDIYAAFAVTVSPSARPQLADTAFAADLAGEMDAGTLQRAPDFACALELAGMTWVRERGTAHEKTDQVMALKGQLSGKELQTIEMVGNGVELEQGGSDWQGLGDLYQTAYLPWKAYPATNNGYTDMFEIFNEQDLGAVPADIYSAYFKAAAIGLADAQERPYVSATGLAMYTGLYFDLLASNDVWRYSNVYNFHAHTDLETRVEWARRYANAYAENERLPLYLTEAGLYQIPQNGDVLSDAQMAQSARYAVTSAVTSFAGGTDRHFWFLFRPYIENGGNFSCFHTSYLPYPSYAALSNLTYRLGEGQYRGVLRGLPEGVSGHLFDNGLGSDVAVLWADSEQTVTIQADGVLLSDLYGRETRRTADGTGSVAIACTQDPVFVLFDARCDSINYYPVETSRAVVQHSALQVQDRVVLQPLWQGQHIPDTAIRTNGYVLDAGQTATVLVNVYNLNEVSVTGTLEVRQTGQDFMVQVEEPHFTLRPWETAQIAVTLIGQDCAEAGEKGKIWFGGQLQDGRNLSPAVSAYQFRMTGSELIDQNVTLFPAFSNPANWNLQNAAPNTSTMTDNGDGSYTVKNIFTTSEIWAFPRMRVADATVLQGTTGITFDRICAADSTMEKTSVMIYMKDDRVYYSGEAFSVPYTDEWERLVFPWEMFTLYSSPAGNVEIREFHPSDIASIAIGISGGRQDQPAYTVKNFGYYTLAQTQEISVTGVESGKIYQQGELSRFTVTFPVEDYRDIRVINHTTPYENWLWREDRKVVVNTDTLDSGYYRFYISVRDDMNLAKTVVVAFYIV